MSIGPEHELICFSKVSLFAGDGGQSVRKHGEMCGRSSRDAGKSRKATEYHRGVKGSVAEDIAEMHKHQRLAGKPLDNHRTHGQINGKSRGLLRTDEEEHKPRRDLKMRKLRKSLARPCHCFIYWCAYCLDNVGLSLISLFAGLYYGGRYFNQGHGELE